MFWGYSGGVEISKQLKSEKVKRSSCELSTDLVSTEAHNAL